MDSDDGRLIPPRVPGVVWRPLQRQDVGAIVDLIEACLAADGGLPLATDESVVQESYLSVEIGASIGAFESDTRLVACAAVQRVDSPEACRAAAVGQVRPDHRGCGLGTFLVGWISRQGERLLSDAPADRPHMMDLTIDTLTDAAEQLFLRHGLEQRFAEDVMRIDVIERFAGDPLVVEISLSTWTPQLADQFFEAYKAAFRDRPGFPGWSKEKWIDWATAGDDFRSEASFLACYGDLPVGFIVCADGWIVQVGVRPGWRRRGIGSGLVVAALSRLHAAGARHVLLDVNVNNPIARRMYEQLGFKKIGRRARFARTLP